MKTSLVVVAAALAAAPAFAQSTSETWNGLPDRFKIDTGYFDLKADTLLRYNGPAGGSGEVSFENDLGLNKSVNTFWIDGTWRLGRRHQLKLSYTRVKRDRANYALQRDFTWGGETYSAGLSATATTGSDILGGYYRFALYRNDRFEIGPAVGVGYLWLSAGIQASGTVGSESRDLDHSASTGSITGAVGGYASAWLTKRLAVSGDYLYIKVSSGETTAAVTDWRVAADYYFFRNAGLGAQYKYYRYNYDRGLLVSKLAGELTFQGGQVYLSFKF